MQAHPNAFLLLFKPIFGKFRLFFVTHQNDTSTCWFWDHSIGTEFTILSTNWGFYTGVYYNIYVIKMIDMLTKSSLKNTASNSQWIKPNLLHSTHVVRFPTYFGQIFCPKHVGDLTRNKYGYCTVSCFWFFVNTIQLHENVAYRITLNFLKTTTVFIIIEALRLRWSCSKVEELTQNF